METNNWMCFHTCKHTLYESKYRKRLRATFFDAWIENLKLCAAQNRRRKMLPVVSLNIYSHTECVYMYENTFSCLFPFLARFHITFNWTKRSDQTSAHTTGPENSWYLEPSTYQRETSWVVWCFYQICQESPLDFGPLARLIPPLPTVTPFCFTIILHLHSPHSFSYSANCFRVWCCRCVPSRANGRITPALISSHTF